MQDKLDTDIGADLTTIETVYLGETIDFFKVTFVNTGRSYCVYTDGRIVEFTEN